MGIGNLNNNFGNLTAGNIVNKGVAKNSAKAEAINLKAQVKTDSLNSATLGENEGQVFDSNNIDLDKNINGKGSGRKGGGWYDRFRSYRDQYLQNRLPGWPHCNASPEYQEETAFFATIHGLWNATFH